MSFFGQRDLADLTTTIMADSAFMETAFSHFIPELYGSLISTVLVALEMFFVNWKMALAVFWVVPAAFIISVSIRPVIDKKERKQKEKKLAASDGIQECIENAQDIKANNQREDYLENLDEKLIGVEKATIVTEYINGILVTSFQMILKIGMATTVLAGVKLMIGGEIDFFLLLMFLIAATRVYEPLSGSLTNLSAVFSTLLVVVLLIAHRMRTVAGADKIIVLKDAEVAEQGSPKELMEKNGIFKHMFELQKKTDTWVMKKSF